MEMVVRYILTLILLISASNTLIFGDESTRLGLNDGSITIRWESLDTSYRIQVRRDNQIFIDTQQDANELRLNLAPGMYEYRIHVLNPFGKDVSVSPWQSLNVESTRIPLFRVKNPLVIWEGETEISMAVESALIREGTIFKLTNGTTAIPAEWQKNGAVYTVKLSDSKLEPGSWDLTATDPSGKSFTHPEAVIVRPTRSPEVNELETRELPAQGLVPIILKGMAFDPEMTVQFEGSGRKLDVLTVGVNEGNYARVYLDLNNAEPGEYNLIVSNPSGKETRVEKALTITIPVTEEIILEQPRFDFQLGYAPTALFVPGGGILPVYLGFDFAALFQSGWKKPFFRGLGVEFRAFGGMSGPIDMNKMEVHGIGSLDISGYYRPLVRGKVAPVFILGIGNMWSGYAKQYGIHNILFLRSEISMDIANNRKLTRIGLSFNFAAAGGEMFPFVSLVFRRGRRY